MKALENKNEILASQLTWYQAFREDAELIGTIGGQKVLWHKSLGIWGNFGQTGGKGGSLRPWNAFGQKSHDFPSNIIVEINMPTQGIDQNLQAVFATDPQGNPWLLHQGRMSVAGSRVTEADFIAATGLKPSKVDFSDGTSGAYHKVANLNAPPVVMRENVAAFIAHCARARQAKLSQGSPVLDLTATDVWERSLRPENTGTFPIAPRRGGTGLRVHGEIWSALAAELKKRNVLHSNDRVSLYGPDLYTYGNCSKVLFEIKSQSGAQDIFGGVGQLQIYDLLLGGAYRKVLVVPEGISKALHGPVASLKVETVEFRRVGKKIVLNQTALSRCLK